MTACEKAIRYLLAKMDEESGDVMTLPVLQKLLYYSQGFSLTMTGKPLFEEDFEVWQMGPVIPALFEKYGKEPGFRILNSSETETRDSRQMRKRGSIRCTSSTGSFLAGNCGTWFSRIH